VKFKGGIQMRQLLVLLGALLGGPAAHAADPTTDTAAAFGARPDVQQMSLSPDGSSVAYIKPMGSRGAALSILSLAKDAKPRIALTSNGTPERITGCHWVANDRLVCRIVFIGPAPDLFSFSRLVAVNVDGSNIRILNAPQSFYSRGVELSSSGLIDLLPEEDGVVLMSRAVVANDRIGSHFGTAAHGLALDRVDTRTLTIQSVVPPNEHAGQYITDGHGDVRIMAQSVRSAGQMVVGLHYLYRDKGGSAWHELSAYNIEDGTGFRPVAVDRDQNVAYGFRKTNGRLAVFTKALDASATETLVYAREDVDVDRLLQIGRHQRVVGVSYATDYRHTQYTDPKFEQLATALGKALPRATFSIVDSNIDESKLLLFVSSDTDAGVYYLFDHNTHHLDTFLVVRSALEGVTLAPQRPVTLRAKDGASIPGYLTLPPGKADAKGLPAIVMPHGGPSARDEWGFNWLVQYFASRGYAVLQPNFRGSSGYGDAWFEHNGFQSWQLAIGDVLDAGRWLVSEGIADPKKLAIVGWSYGGYAALQSVVADATVFRAAIAIAPVSDLPTLTEQYRHWSNYYLALDFIGTGAHLHEGSPAQNAAKIKVPVLLFHGSDDNTVRIEQSQLMDRALAAAGAKHELVTFDGLDHQLDDSGVRTDMLRRSDAFLQEAFSH
jgi:dipeptidyl aminopeptidase/acylaminoacyl peptidase